MISVNDDIKQAYSLSTTQIDRIILNDTPYYITNVEYSDNCYQDGNVFGTAEARQLAFEIENSVNLERQEYEYQTGIVVDGNVEWISLGNFITFDTEEDDTNGITKVNAMDNIIKSNVLYDHTSLDYSVGVTIKEILEDALEQCGLELGTNSFVNSDFVCYSDQFEDNALIRQVIIACAQISGTFAKIRSDNKLYLINPNKALYGDLVTEEDIYLKTEKGNKLILLERRIDKESGVAESNTFFDLRDYENTTLKRNTHEINTLVLGLSNVEGENVTVRDEDMIAEDGNENKIVINDNPFAYTQALRTQLINPIFNSIKGFAYTAYELKCQGLPYLECGDSVSVKTIEGNSIESYVFRYSFKSPNGLDSTIEAPSLTDAEVLYENVENLDTRLRRTEIVVDKENQQIQSIVAEIGDRSGKSTTITQDIDGIQSLVQETIDITRVAQGTDPLTFINCMSGYLLELHIYGNNDVFGGLYPRNNLYPSDSLYPRGDSRIRIWTDNICPSLDWENKSLASDGSAVVSYQSVTSPYVSVSELEAYVSLENPDYKIQKICAYNSSKLLLSGMTEEIVNDYQEIVSLPTGTAYVRLEVKAKSNNDISITNVGEIKPMIVYGDEKIDYCGNNDVIFDLRIPSVLRRFINQDEEVIRDEFELVNNRGTLIRRVGVDSGGNLYELPTEERIDLGGMSLPIAEGKNYFEIVNYTATCMARYVIINEYTSTFATTVELSSSITQMADELRLEVSRKVDQDDYNSQIQLLYDAINLKVSQNNIVSALNLGIRNGQGVVEILGNLIRIATDYFKVNLDGKIEATGGKIASFDIGPNAIQSENCGMSNNQYYAFWCRIANVDTFRVTWNGDVSCATLLVDGNPLIKTNAGAQEVKTIYADNGQLVAILNNAVWVFIPDGGGSDEKLKKNIKNSKIKALDEISKMRFAEFDWKATGEYQDIGLIAQELEKINPSLVSEITIQDDTQKIINNSKLIFYSLKGVQELQEKVNKQQEEIDELRKMIEELKKGEK